MKKVLKAIGLGILAVLVAVMIQIPLNYVYERSELWGKILIIIGLFTLMCFIIYSVIKEDDHKTIEKDGDN